MHVDLELIARRSFRMEPVINPTQWRTTATMLSTAISRRKHNPVVPVTFLELPWPQIPFRVWSWSIIFFCVSLRWLLHFNLAYAFLSFSSLDFSFVADQASGCVYPSSPRYVSSSSVNPDHTMLLKTWSHFSCLKVLFCSLFFWVFLMGWLLKLQPWSKENLDLSIFCFSRRNGGCNINWSR